MKAKVTVAIAMYNVEKYLSTCLDSVIKQTYENLEVIIVDDGSPDSSGQIAEEYAQKNKRIRVVHQLNSGLGGARNAALDLATGEYITFVDSDDYLMPDFVEYMVNLIERENAEIAISKNCFTTSDRRQVNSDSYETYTSEQAVTEFFLPNIRLGAWNKIYNLKFLKDHALRFVPELKTGEGLQFITLAAYHAKKISVGHRKVYVYRINNSTSATSKANVERQGIGSLETMEYIRKHLQMRTPVEKKAFQWHLWSCHKYCLRQIVESRTESVYPELYSKCIDYLRSESWNVISAPISLRHKMVVLAEIISPVLFAKMQIFKKNMRQGK